MIIMQMQMKYHDDYCDDDIRLELFILLKFYR